LPDLFFGLNVSGKSQLEHLKLNMNRKQKLLTSYCIFLDTLFEALAHLKTKNNWVLINYLVNLIKKLTP